MREALDGYIRAATTHGWKVCILVVISKALNLSPGQVPDGLQKLLYC